MHRSTLTLSSTASPRAALALLALVGCVPLGGDAPQDGASVGPAADTGSADETDTAADTGSAHAVAPVPEVLRDELAALGKVRVIVEMSSRAIPGLSAKSSDERAALLSDRARAYGDARDALVQRLPPTARVERAYTHVPLVTLEVTAIEALDLLARDREVVALHVDEAYEPFMDESLSLIHQPEAEAAGHTGAGTAVAILDTGLDYSHADFGSCTAVGAPAECRVVAVADLADADGTLDDNGHGTNVAAIVGGVAPGTDLIGLDVFRSNGLAYTSEVIAGIDWVIDNQATYNIVALNMSLGGGSYTAECPGTSYEIAIAAALDAGVVSAVATGNNAWSNKIASPACSPSAVKVGAVYDSSYGGIGWSGCTDATTAADQVTCFSNSASFIDLLAPGAMINAGGYQMGGTSQATPHVAGALAVVAAAYPDESPSDWTQRLVDTGVTITDHRNGFDFPRIDVEAAVADSDTCSVSVDHASLSISDAGDTGTLTVSAGEGCEWTVAADASWISLSTASGSGDGSIAWTVGANAGDARTATLTIDSTTIQATQGANAAPTGTVVANTGDAFTPIRGIYLALSASDANDSVAEMCIANVDGNASATCSTWETYSTTKVWQVSTGQGSKQVGVWFRDTRGRESAMATDTITLDTIAPSGSSLSTVATNGGAVLTWDAATDAGSGVAGYSVVYQAGSSAPASCTAGTTAYEGTGLTATVTGLTNESTYAFRLCGTDAIGNTDSMATGTVVPSESAGGPGTLVINDGDAWTNGRAVSLAMTSGIDGATELCVSNTAECAAWRSDRAAMSWTLPSDQGPHTVYLWHRNDLGQESPPATATISLDSVRPKNGVLTATSSSGGASLSWAGFADADSGIAEMVAVMQAGIQAPRNCVSGTEVYRGSGASASVGDLTNGDVYGVRLCAVDAAGNYSSGATALLSPQSSSGPRGSIVLNGGDDWTSERRLTVTVDSAGADEICLSNGFRCSNWKAVESSMVHTLPDTQGERTVYARFRTTSGTESSVVADTIQYDRGRPADSELSIEKSSQTLAVSWDAATDGRSGIESYILVAAEDSLDAPRSCADGTVMWEGTDTSATLTGLTDSIPYGVRVCAIDAAGNMSRGATGTGWPGSDYTAPTGSFVLADGAEWINYRRLDATFDVSDAGSGIRDVCISRRDRNCTVWVPFETVMQTALANQNGTQTLYAWVRDHQGNVSEMLEDAIGLDLARPAGGEVTTDQGNGQVPVAWADGEDRHSGVASYVLAYAEEGERLRSCEDGTVAYEGAGTSSTVTGLTNGTTYAFAVCTLDEAGNVGRAQTTTGRPATEYDEPTGSISIAAGAAYAGPGWNPVQISASDASGISEMCLRASTRCTEWQPYSAAAQIHMGRDHGERTGNVWLKDGQGNITSTPLADTLIVDARKPTQGTVSATGVSGGVRITATGFDDADSGFAGFYVTGRVAGRKAPAACGRGRDLYQGSDSVFTIDGLSSGTRMKFRVCGVDEVGNVSNGVLVVATPN